jgi:hypothetical protein
MATYTAALSAETLNPISRAITMYKLEDIIQDLKHDTPEVSVLEVIECLERCEVEISDLKAEVDRLTASLQKAMTIIEHDGLA